MTQLVIHQPRIAWDCARAFVRAAELAPTWSFVLVGDGPDESKLKELAHERFVMDIDSRTLSCRVERIDQPSAFAGFWVHEPARKGDLDKVMAQEVSPGLQ